MPDICLGHNNDTNSQELVSYIQEKLIDKGYSVDINYPYKGSLTVDNTQHDSIMIEVNKRLYLNPDYSYNTNLFKVQDDLYKILMEFVYDSNR